MLLKPKLEVGTGTRYAANMEVHHLNCATLCPAARKLINGDGSLLEAGEMVAHCLLIETNRELVLVDTGFGFEDIAMPRKRLGSPFLAMTRPKLREEETAYRQVEALGYDPKDVRHIILTHLDPDHAGGLIDFSWAAVHTTAAEKDAGDHPTWRERGRYRRIQWRHGPEWHAGTPDGESWFGFEAVRDLPGLPPEFLLIPTVGHTRGHAAVAVKASDKWLLHAGDAYFFHGEMDIDNPHCTPGLRLFQRILATDNVLRVQNQQRLRDLKRDHGDEVEVFCAHSPEDLEAMRTRSIKQPTPTVSPSLARS